MGFGWEVGYIAESFANLDGGAQTGTALRGLLDLSADLDLDRLIGLSRVTAKVNVIHAHGESLSDLIGDDLLVSNIDAVPTLRLQNLWLEVGMPGDAWAIRVGKQAVDDDFLSTDGSVLFLHMAAAYPFTLSPNAPPWPVSSLAAQVRHGLNERVTLRTGVFGADPLYTDEAEGNPDGLSLGLDPSGVLVIGEAAFDGPRGFYRIGAWHDTNEFTDANGASNRGLSAIYIAADHLVLLTGGITREEQKGLHMFGTASWSPDREHAPIDYDLRGGAYWRGLLPRRARDVLGAGYFHPHVGPAARFGATGIVTTESFWEVSYHAQLADWWSVQLSAQSIQNPGGRRGDVLPDATVVGVRLSVSL